MLSQIQQRLGLKIFISYLGVIVVGVIVLTSAAELAVPSSFERHLATMSSMMDGMMGGPRMRVDLEQDLFANFRAAVSEALVLATLAAFVAAVVVSLFVSQRVVAPIREMMAASQRIAEGKYHERVRVRGNLARDELDELGQLAVSFNQMADKLEKTETMRRELIGDVAHELRTPLATIKGSMEGLIDRVIPPEASTFREIQREADRLGRLVSDLQELSQAEAGAFELNLKPVRVGDLLQGAVERLQRQYEDKGVSLGTKIHSADDRVLADEDRIGQVLINLLGNALQYTDSGGQVWIASERAGEIIQVRIRDTGIGIPAEHLPLIFTRFYRVDKSRSRVGGGSGVGLTIAKYLVEAHGGMINAESLGAGKGSTFTFTLPLAG